MDIDDCKKMDGLLEAIDDAITRAEKIKMLIGKLKDGSGTIKLTIVTLGRTSDIYISNEYGEKLLEVELCECKKAIKKARADMDEIIANYITVN